MCLCTPFILYATAYIHLLWLSLDLLRLCGIPGAHNISSLFEVLISVSKKEIKGDAYHMYYE